MRRSSKAWTLAEAKANALSLHPECSYADWDNGMAFPFTLTYVIKLWRNERIWASGDPPRHIEEGYIQARKNGKAVEDLAGGVP